MQYVILRVCALLSYFFFANVQFIAFSSNCASRCIVESDEIWSVMRCAANKFNKIPLSWIVNNSSNACISHGHCVHVLCNQCHSKHIKDMNRGSLEQQTGARTHTHNAAWSVCALWPISTKRWLCGSMLPPSFIAQKISSFHSPYLPIPLLVRLSRPIFVFSSLGWVVAMGRENASRNKIIIYSVCAHTVHSRNDRRMANKTHHRIPFTWFLLFSLLSMKL